MANPYFAFKQFTIYHDRCAMKVGTDGVLLGAWVDLTGADNMLDAGTGTGLISLMCAQRAPNIVIDAVEIDSEACDQAQENVNASPWTERIHVHHDTFQHFGANATTHYDLIVSNPPFFRHSLKPPLLSRATARHDDRLSPESLLYYTDSLLTSNGRLAVILPASDFELFVSLAGLYHLHILRQTYIRPRHDKNQSRCLAEFSRQQQPHVDVHEIIIMEKDNRCSAEYISLTKDFYLGF